MSKKSITFVVRKEHKQKNNNIMKAVKLYKISWNLNDLNGEEKEKAMKTLPTVKGFTTQDDFDVVTRVPGLLKKKFGYDVISYSYAELRIVDNINDFLKLFAGKEKPKKLYKNGKKDTKVLSAFGEEMFANFKDNVEYRMKLEDKGEAEESFPILLDEMMLGFEKITGLNWDTLTKDEIIKAVKDILKKKGISLVDIEDLSREEDEDEDMFEDEVEEEPEEEKEEE